MSIERLPFERRPRNSIANNLDRINELVDWVNLDTHLYASATGERVTVDDTSSVKGLTVDGRSVQDGTPTPDAPVPVQVVNAKNLLDVTMTSQTMNGLTFTVNQDKTISVTGTATSDTYMTVGSVNLPDGTYRLSGCPEGGSRTTYRLYYNRSGAVEFDYGRGVTIITNNDGNVQVRIAIYTGTTVDTVFKPQVERGSLTTAYAPYGCIALYINDTPTAIDLQGNTLASLPDGTRDELHVDSTGRVWIEKRVGYVPTNDLSAAVVSPVVLTNFVRIRCARAINNNPAPTSAPALTGYCNIAPYTGSGYGTDSLHCYAHLGDFFIFAPVGDKPTWDATTAAEWITEHGAYAYYTPAATTTIYLGYIIPPAIPSGSVVTVSASLTPTLNLEWWVDDGITALIDNLIAYIDYKTEG